MFRDEWTFLCNVNRIFNYTVYQDKNTSTNIVDPFQGGL